MNEDKLRAALRDALDELIVEDEDYPEYAQRAVDILEAALAASATDEPPPDRADLWEKFTGGEKLAYRLGYRDAERALAASATDEPCPSCGAPFDGAGHTAWCEAFISRSECARLAAEAVAAVERARPAVPALDVERRVRQVITDWGLDLPTSDPPHGWRCQHPELSDPATCGHVDELVGDLVAALRSKEPTDA